MNHWTAPVRRTFDLVMAISIVTVLIPSAVMAQTLTDPSPRPKSSKPPIAAKPVQAAPAKSCNSYGAGFVYYPLTETCIKVGGDVTIEVGR